MKAIFHIRNLLLIAILALAYTSCKDLPVLDDCNVDTDIIIEPNLDCTASVADPCVKTFRLRDFNLLPDGARITWSLTKGGVDISLPNPEAPEIEYGFTEPGFDYAINIQIVFDFEGCDVSLNKPFIIGVDAPVAFISASTQQCIVGECEVTFTANVANVDSWFWTIPGETSDFEGQATVTKSFDERPDTFMVILTASNISGPIKDTMEVFVEPVTFITKSNNTGEILSIDEDTDGSFVVIGTTDARTYTEKINRDGSPSDDPREELNDLPTTWSERSAYKSFKIADRHIVVGMGVNSNDQNQNAYLAALDQNYALIDEQVYAHDLDGRERAFGITNTPDNGYLLCGGKNTIVGSQPTGMLFIKLSQNFAKESAFVRMDSSANNRAFGIISTNDGYAVIGRAFNTADEENQGCFFKMTPDFDVIEPIQYLGGFVPTELIKIDEGSYVILARNGSDGTSMIRGVGNLNWSEPYGDFHFERGLLTAEYGLVITGYKTVQGKDIPILFSIDPGDGKKNNLIDESYELEDGSGRIFSISRTRENGFVLGGDFRNSTEDVGLMIRTNKLGIVSN